MSSAEVDAAARAAGVNRATMYRRLGRGMSIAEAVALGRTRSGNGTPASSRLDVPWARDHEARAAVAERGAMPAHEVAAMMGVTRQRIDQIAERAMFKVRRTIDLCELDFDRGTERTSVWDAIEAEAVEF